jgi:hypothetical protein
MLAPSITMGYAFKASVCLEGGDCLSRQSSDGVLRGSAGGLLAFAASGPGVIRAGRGDVRTDRIRGLF